MKRSSGMNQTWMFRGGIAYYGFIKHVESNIISMISCKTYGRVKQVNKFELKDAVNLFSQQTSIINSLWPVYVGATFAAAGFGGTYLSNIVDTISVIITSIGLTI